GLWLLPECLANIAGYRSGGHDSEGESEVAGQGRCRGASALHCRVIRPRCLNESYPHFPSKAPPCHAVKLRNGNIDGQSLSTPANENEPWKTQSFRMESGLERTAQLGNGA